MNLNFVNRVAAALLLLFCSFVAEAAITLPSIISDGMVLQQDAQVPLWGKSEPGSLVTIQCSWDGQLYSATTSTDGRWRIIIPTPSHCKGQSLIIREGRKVARRIIDVLVGDVWMCTGQSNMEFPVATHPTKKWMNGVVGEQAELADADYPEIHLFHVERQQSIGREADDVVGHWMVCNRDNVAEFSAIGFMFIRQLHNALHMPMGMIEDCWAGTHAESWIPLDVMQLRMEFYGPVLTQFAEQNIKRDDDICKIPASLWNGMIAPVCGYAVKGNIWYQGESNCVRASQYEQVMTDLINTWRTRWNEPHMPFYMVQIAPHRQNTPELRQAQVEIIRSVPNTALAIITDAGEKGHIHPRAKRVVAERLAAIALARDYGQKVPWMSPSLASVSRGDAALHLTFNNAETGLVKHGDSHEGFFVSGDDNRFYPAHCTINGSRVTISSPQVKNPKYVRFGWSNYFENNLFSAEGLPVIPFRTDTFGEAPLYRRFADSEMTRFPHAYQLDHGRRLFFGYSQGVGCMAMLRVWQRTGDSRYYDYVKAWADSLVDAKGNIHLYKPEEYQLDFINSGKILLTLYKHTHDRRYLLASDRLVKQMKHQPRTYDGAYWHKKIYENQMWLDGLYMAHPFLAEYANITGKTRWHREVIRQFSLCRQHLRDSRTCLYYHGWDASHKQRWADPVTGCSPCFWGRSIGWLAMAMVDVLDVLPTQTEGRDSLLLWFNELADAVVKYQDKNGLWSQVIDQPGRKGNFTEASVCTQLMYALARGVNQGYLPARFMDNARLTLAGLRKKHLDDCLDGTLSLLHCCQVGGLGGKPYRDGSFDYYIHEKMRSDDAKATGPFIMALLEMGE